MQINSIKKKLVSVVLKAGFFGFFVKTKKCICKLLLLFCLPSFSVASQEKIYAIDLASQNVGDALMALSEQVDTQFFLRASLVEGVFSQQLRGNYTLVQALGILLENTGLVGEITARGQIKVTKDHGYYNNDFEPVLAPFSPQIEEVLVSGLRYAWQSSSALKRQAIIIKDILSESDMNKLPDGNVADSLQRINGLQIERRNGDGTRFRIRGFDKNITLYNGEVFLTGLEYFQLGLDEQGYENSIETVPVELLRRIEVYKSVRASDIEGAIGGTVDLISRNAFDVVDYLATADLKMDYGQYSKQAQPELFLGLGKNWDNHFSSLFTLNYAGRSMHMDIARSYVDRGVERRNVTDGDISTYSDGDIRFDYLSPRYSSLASIEQTRDQSGASLNVGWRPNTAVEFQFEWFGIYSRLEQIDYEMLFSVNTPFGSELSFNMAHELPFLQSANYESGDQIFRTIGESFSTRANNFDLRASIDMSANLFMDVRLAVADSSFTADVGNADLLGLTHTSLLPYWIGEEEFIAPGIDGFRSATGWTTLANTCLECLDGSSIEHPIQYDNASPYFAMYQGREGGLNRAEDTFGAFQQAKGAKTEQEAWSLRSDIDYTLNGSEENRLTVGFRVNQRKATFNQHRFLTNFSETEGAARPAQFDTNGQRISPSTFSPARPSDDDNIGIRLPVFYDLCGNGGLLNNQVCDIDADGYDDNLPNGPWVYQINPIEQRRMLTELNNYSDIIYGQDFFFNPPGFMPWRPYSLFPEDYIRLTDFFPSEALFSHTASFVNGEGITDDVEQWISAVAPRSPTKRFDIPRNSWVVEQQNSAAYVELNLHSESLPLFLNAGLRYVETHMHVRRSVVRDGSGISLTMNPWYVSGVGNAWHKESTKNTYRHLLPSANVTWAMNDRWQVRVAASNTIAYPSFSQLGQGDGPTYEADIGFDGVDLFEFNRATALSTGNANLKPTRISQGDISLEYYGDLGRFFQLTLFYKDIHAQVFNKTLLASVVDSSIEGSTEAPVTRPENGAGGHAKGIELAMQYIWHSGYGTSLNFSHNDTSSDISSLTMNNISLPGVSKNTVNWGAFFENTSFRAQLSYLWRDEFLAPYGSLNTVDFDVETGQLVELAQIYEDYGQWDVRMLYFFSDNLTLSLDLLNVTESTQRSYLEFKENRQSHATWEPRIIFGLQFEY